MEFLVPVLAFAAVVSLVAAIAAITEPRRARARLARLGADAREEATSADHSLLVSAREGAVARTLRRVGRRQALGETGPLRQRLVHAGYRSAAAPAVYYGTRLVLALALPAIAAALAFAGGLPQLQFLLLLCTLAAVGWIGPSIWLDTRRSRRQNEIRRTLPDALDLMVVCVEAGYAINASLARVAEEFASRSPHLSTEFNLVVAETRAGKALPDALRGLAERTGVEDVHSLVALLVQTERFGTSVGNALRVHAEAMRVRRMQRAEERAQKAPLKLILPSTLIFAALLMIFLAPSLYRFKQAFPE